jgi:hypothetical protein
MCYPKLESHCSVLRVDVTMPSSMYTIDSSAREEALISTKRIIAYMTRCAMTKIAAKQVRRFFIGFRHRVGGHI